MFFGEFTSGSIVYKYQSKYLRKKENEAIIALIKKNHPSFEKNQFKINKIKVYILLIIATFLDFVEFIITTFYIKNFNFISASFDSRCNSFLAISNAFGYRYLLKFKIFKHQIFSLIIISVCFVIILSTEYIFQITNEIFTYGEFTVSLVLILLEYFYLSLMDIIDKYLLEYESTDPFFIMVNKLYSPMVLTLSDYFLNPLYIIYDYIDGDFNSKNGQNIFYFVLNLILSILTVLSTFIFNEFIVLFCFGFERNTHDQITKRSIDEKIEMKLYDDNDEEPDNEIKEEEIESKSGTYKIMFN
jgi:hypothetical protein